jgi:hypothetical protein
MDTLKQSLQDLAARIRTGDSAAVEQCVGELVPLIARVVLASVSAARTSPPRGSAWAWQEHHRRTVALATRRVAQCLTGDSPPCHSATTDTVFG